MLAGQAALIALAVAGNVHSMSLLQLGDLLLDRIPASAWHIPPMKVRLKQGSNGLNQHVKHLATLLNFHISRPVFHTNLPDSSTVRRNRMDQNPHSPGV